MKHVIVEILVPTLTNIVKFTYNEVWISRQFVLIVIKLSRLYIAHPITHCKAIFNLSSGKHTIHPIQNTISNQNCTMTYTRLQYFNGLIHLSRICLLQSEKTCL